MEKINKKIFISSTINDLKDERAYLKESIPKINNKYINFVPVLSEHSETFHFTESDLSKHDSIHTCLNKVLECHYFVLLIKSNYTYNEKNCCSVTELEYKKAKRAKKKIFVFAFDNEINRNPLCEKFLSHLREHEWVTNVKDVSEIVKILDEQLNNLDASKFISENPPDGKYILNCEKTTKTWVIKNNGNILWKDRYMYEIEGNENFKPFSKKITMPDIRPGEEYIFSVEYECKKSGDFYSCWKMFYNNGEKCFPSEYIGLWITACVRWGEV